jgi:hypothetical protein
MKEVYVTKTQFVRILNQLGMLTQQSVVELLLKNYMDRGNSEEMNYFDFCGDVDKPEDMFGAGRNFNHSWN